jgi:hypothetical protein
VRLEGVEPTLVLLTRLIKSQSRSAIYGNKRIYFLSPCLELNQARLVKSQLQYTCLLQGDFFIYCPPAWNRTKPERLKAVCLLPVCYEGMKLSWRLVVIGYTSPLNFLTFIFEFHFHNCFFYFFYFLIYLSSETDLNRQPSDYKSDALPIVLSKH